MTREEAIRILDPETTGEAISEIEYYGGFSGRTAASLLTGKNLCKEAQGLRPELFSLDRHVPGTVLSGGFRGILRGTCGVLHQRAIAVIDGLIGFMSGGWFGGRMGGRRGRRGRHLRRGQHRGRRSHTGIPIGAAAAGQHCGGKDKTHKQ